MGENKATNPAKSMQVWLTYAFIFFGLLRSISITLHYLGPSPYGGELIISPNRFIANSILIELGIFMIPTLLFYGVAHLIKLKDRLFRLLYVILASIYLIFTQLDQEIVRWMGEHISVSYLTNYFRKTDGEMLGKLLGSDIVFTAIAGVLMILSVVLAVFIFRRPQRGALSPKKWIIVAIVEALLLTSPWWLMESDKRWRRIQPVAMSLTIEIARDLFGLDTPDNPKQAYADLLQYLKDGQLAQKPLDQIPEFPLYQETGPGKIPRDEWKKLPKSEKPNIIYVMFETWRGWKTGLVDDNELKSFTPTLDSIIKKEAYYFPFVHSPGFPSVEGAVGIHLGIWTHFRNIIISTAGSIRTKSLPELFRDMGYRTEIFIGADPSFSNLTPWFRRWYQYFEYSRAYAQDGPLIDRFITALDTINRSNPFFLTTWTVTTHPPYKIPKSEGIPIADNNPDRYDQAIVYAEKQILRLIEHLKKSDLWDNSVLVIVGDHAQPQLAARRNSEIAGQYTPGHTWVHAAIMGGWKGLPAPRRNDNVINQIDIAPTLLDLVDVSIPNHFMGHSQLNPRSQEFLSFRMNNVALFRENERLLFNMFSDDMLYTPMDKNNRKDYALLKGHRMKKSEAPPWDFDLERYRDMIFAYGELLTQDRLFPREERKLGKYNHIKK